MKITKWMSALAIMAVCGIVSAETVHQKAPGEKATVQDKKFLETREMREAESGKITRITGEMNQWGYVSYWMGIATPPGKSTIRLRIYNDGGDTASYGIYKHSPDGQDLLQKLVIPADAEKGKFVVIDIPVDSKIEWGGVTVKKLEKNDKPSPWIDTVSVILPD